MGTEKNKAKGHASRDAVMAELVGELRHLRGGVREVGESFILRSEGEIETLISHLAAVPTALLKREASAWLGEIRDLKLKPAKGRLKDLKGIERLIEGLANQVIHAQDGKK
jgi:hypothetical protein